MREYELLKYKRLREKRRCLEEDLIRTEVSPSSTPLPPTIGGRCTDTADRIIAAITLADNIRAMLEKVEQEMTEEYKRLIALEDNLPKLQQRILFHHLYIFCQDLAAAASEMHISLSRGYSLKAEILKAFKNK